MKKVLKKNRKKVIILFAILILLLLAFFMVWYFGNDNSSKLIVEKKEEKIDLNVVKGYYHDYVTVLDGSSLYELVDGEYKIVSTLYGNVELQLDSTYEINDEYFKIKDNDWYIFYDKVQKIDSLSPVQGQYKSYKNYIVYNENIVLKEKAKLYVGDSSYYEIDGGSYPIIIKENDRYGIEYNQRLVYVLSSDVLEVIPSNNTTFGHTDDIGVLNYHFTVSGTNENGEMDECRQSICITDTMFDSHMKYLSDNGYYAVSMRDLELFIEGKIQLPERSVSITIDDGWYVQRSIWILEKYQILGTLFLIGSLASPNDYRSPYLEVHSHTWNMHGANNGDDCPNSSRRGGITCLDDETILNDLRKSRESLGNTTYFCFPFYDNTNKAISLLKEAGFTMAFIGGERKAKVFEDKYRVPRYVITKYTTMNQFIRYVS